MKSYCGMNPGLFHIDFYRTFDDDDEATKLERICLLFLCTEECCSVVEGTTEWIKVDRELYLKVCKKGFRYFVDKYIDAKEE